MRRIGLIAAGLGSLVAVGTTALALLPGSNNTPPTTTNVETTRPPVVPPPRPEPDRVVAAIDDILASLTLANVAFNAPGALRLHETTVVQLRMSGDRPVVELKAEITELGEKVGAQVRASDRMEANLTGLGFKIQAVTPAVQPVGREATTEWRWQIEPAKTGTQRLHLTLSALIDVAGSESTYHVRTFEHAMDIRVTFGERVSSFIGDNWQWLWAAIVLPAGGFLLRWRKSRSGSRGDAGRRTRRGSKPGSPPKGPRRSRRKRARKSVVRG